MGPMKIIIIITTTMTSLIIQRSIHTNHTPLERPHLLRTTQRFCKTTSTRIPTMKRIITIITIVISNNVPLFSSYNIRMQFESQLFLVIIFFFQFFFPLFFFSNRLECLFELFISTYIFIYFLKHIQIVSLRLFRCSV